MSKYAHVINFLKNKKSRILIWGYGKTGNSYFEYLKINNYDRNLIYISDKKFDNNIEDCIEFFRDKIIQEKYIELLIDNFDYILISPGINLNEFNKKYNNIYLEKEINKKILSEFDIFWYLKRNAFIIAVTGSLGKTSTCNLLFQALSQSNSAIICGNIGVPVLSLLYKTYDIFIIEISSAQLYHTKLFIPNYAIITNLYHNHIDHHGTFESYVHSKLKILTNNFYQIENIFMSMETYDFLINKNYQVVKKRDFKKKLILHREDVFEEVPNITKKKCNYLFFYKNEFYKNQGNRNFYLGENFFNISYHPNLMILINVILNMGYKFSYLKNVKYSIPRHRLEICEESNDDIIIFNDSKCTTQTGTLKAVLNIKKNYENKVIVLILGGLSKGVNRSLHLQEIYENVKSMIFFGKETLEFKVICEKINIKCSFAQDLKSAIDLSLKLIGSNGIILFSPGGSSFDCFSSYEERGDVFKKLLSKAFEKSLTRLV